MNQQQALDVINAALCKTLDKKDISVTMETDLIGEKVLDSLDGMVFLLEVAERTDRKFPEDDLVLQGFYKIKTLVDFLISPAT